MKKISLVFTALLLICTVVVLEAKTPKECNSGSVSGCSGIKSDGTQYSNESKCSIESSKGAECVVNGSAEKVGVKSMQGENAVVGSDIKMSDPQMIEGKVVVGSDGKKYVDYTVGSGVVVVSPETKVSGGCSCSCDCCKKCEKCSGNGK